MKKPPSGDPPSPERDPTKSDPANPDPANPDPLDLDDLEDVPVTPPPGEPPPRITGRRGVLGLAVLLTVTGAAVADRLSPPSAPAPAALVAPISPGGVLACPFLFHGNGRSWVHLANAGAQQSKITVTTVRDGKVPPMFRTFTLEPGRTRTLPLDLSVKQPSGAIVDFAGGQIAASRTSLFSYADGQRGGVAAPCLPAGARTLVTPSGSTLKSDTTLILLNPSTSDAVADVSLLADGEETQKEGLKAIVVGARSRKTFRLGDFAFDQPSVAAVVRVRSGVLAADALIGSARGLTLSPGVAPSESLAGVAAGDGGIVLADVVGLGENDSVTDASVLTPEGQTAFSALAQALEPASPQSVQPHDKKAPAIGVRISLRDGSPLAAGLRWVVQLPNGKGDVAAGMVQPPERRLFAVSGEPASAPQSRILVANASGVPATIRFTLMTEAGRQPAGTIPEVTLDAGKTISVPIGAVKGPFAVLAESTQVIAMTLSSTVIAKEVSAFSVSGVAVFRPEPVAVDLDPRLGVPAR